MKSLQIRETPKELYEVVKKTAESEGRSISQQALFFLAKGANVSLSAKQQRKTLIEKFIPLKISKKFNVRDIISEDRKR